MTLSQAFFKRTYTGVNHPDNLIPQGKEEINGMAKFDAPIEIKGTATVQTEMSLSAEEEKAAQYMTELVATLQLLSVNTYNLEGNVMKFKEIADLFGISIERAEEIFRSLKVERLMGESGIGPLNLKY